jgi:hypothetical protein
MVARLGKEKVPYVTHRQHGKKPPGMKCLASRQLRCLVLEFEDGEVVELEERFYAKGLEAINDPIGIEAEDDNFWKVLDEVLP